MRSPATLGLLAVLLLASACSDAERDPDPLPDAAQLPADPDLRAAIVEQRASIPASGSQGYGAAVGELGRRYHAAGLLGAAVKCYEIAGLAEPTDPTWPHLIGYAEQQRGDLAAALVAYDRSVELGGAPGRLRRAEARFAAGDVDGAEEDWRAVLDFDPDQAAALYGLGRIALLRAEPEPARQWLNRALEAAPQAGRIRHSLGLALRDLGLVEEAAVALAAADSTPVPVDDPYTAAIASPRSGGRAALRRGQALLDADPEAALAEFRAAAADDARDVEALRNIAIALTRLGRPAEAAAAYRDLVAADPQDAAAWMGLGTLLLSRGEIEEAVPALEEALSLAPDFLQAKYALGTARLRQSRPREAVALFDAVVAVDPDYEAVRVQRALAMLALGQVREAEAELVAQVERSPADFDAQVALGGLFSQQGRAGEAAQRYLAALRVRPEAVAVRLGAAQELARSGDCAGALTVVRAGLATASTHADLLDAESQLSQVCGS